ncbi:hypothetical protein [Spirosoma fluviale]|uniref:Uncharacterized protein n=1 Tax=Spirosoma fluviale TaxID=1597977 RepID=A0A286GJY1_9BACT|nr:hypothetical protein [Spirosoma fluviale]SOD95419.1 hypothetical protein SAMN06269250_4855 [Spirosoma fluviale]
MGAIRLIQKPQNGQITFKVPDEMRDEPIIVEFRPAKEESQPEETTTLAEASQAFFAKLNRVKIDFSEEDYNVYEQ